MDSQTTGKNRRYKPSLRIVSVEFVPSPDAERRLARVYELLLRENNRKLHPEKAGQDTNKASEDGH